MRQFKKHFSVLLTFCILSALTFIPSGAAAADAAQTSGIIINLGDDEALIKPQWNCTDQVKTEVVKNKSPYGKAYAMTAGEAGCGWNGYKTGFAMPRGDNDISEMSGFAFYVKAPDANRANPLLDMIFWNTDSRCLNTFKNGEPIYYVASGTENIEREIFNGGEFPLSGRPGFEGFVFIPFTSMQNTWGGEGIDISNLNNYDSFEVRVSIANTDASLANQTYILDEFGYYTDQLEYIALVEESAAGRIDVDPVEYVANDAAYFNAWSDYNEHFTVSSAASPHTGRAYNLYSGGTNPNYYWAHFPLPHGDVNVSATKGVAFYVEIPDDLDNCSMQVRFYINDNAFYNDPILNKMYYVADGSDEVETQTIQPGYYPFQGKKGFKGWFFLPYGAMQRNGLTTNAAAVNAAENFQIQLCVISGNQADHKRNYIVDQIGYYSDPLSYIKSATEGYGAAGDFDNNGSINTTDLVYLRKLLLGIGEKTDKVYQSCDIDKDGEISVIDMIRLKKAMA